MIFILKLTSGICSICVMMEKFVNSYASFFYIAFLGSRLSHGRDDDDNDEDEDSRYRGNCGGRQSCMAMLAINLAVVFGE